MAEQGKIRKLSTRIQKNPTLVVVPILVISAIAVTVAYHREIWEVFSSPERFSQVVRSWGIWAPIGFIVLQIIQVVISIIPGGIPQIAGGYLFGLVEGTVYSTIGILLGSSFNFWLARLLGVPFVRGLFKEEQIRSFDRIAHHPRAQIGFFLLFVIPGLPKDVLCYVAGLSPLRFIAFLIISTVGRMPGIVGSAAMGSAAASSRWVVAGTLLAISGVLLILGLIYRERAHAFIERFALKSPYRSRTDPAADDCSTTGEPEC